MSKPVLSRGNFPRSLFFFPCLLLTRALAAVEVTTTIIIPAPTQSPSSSYTSDNEFKNTILDVTNRYRREHNADKLKWNETLVDTALDWAEKCKWEHSHGATGENLAMGFRDVESAVEAWGDERDLYDFEQPTGFTDETGHFTQLVWKGTTTVGCARVNCGVDVDDNGRDDGDDDDDDDDVQDAQGWYVVCEYWPPGNVIGDQRFKSNVLSTTNSSGDGDGDDEGGFPGAASGLGSRCPTWPFLGFTFGIAVLL